jgi:hypothetical protein
MLTEDVEFDIGQMVDPKLAKKSESMRNSVGMVKEALKEVEEKPKVVGDKKKSEGVKRNAKKTGVASKKRKKVG